MPRGPHGNQAYLFMMGDQAGRERASTTWSLQHRLPDGHAWVEIGHFPTKELATETANAFVVAEYGKSDGLPGAAIEGSQEISVAPTIARRIICG